MEEELARMEARYRVGDGDGVAVVTPRTNCSQDSAYALYAVTRQIAELDQKIAVYHEFPESRISPKRSKRFGVLFDDLEPDLVEPPRRRDEGGVVLSQLDLATAGQACIPNRLQKPVALARVDRLGNLAREGVHGHHTSGHGAQLNARVAGPRKSLQATV